MRHNDPLYLRSRELLGEHTPQRPHTLRGHVWTGMRSPIDNLDVGDLGDGGSKGKDVATRQRWNGAAARWVMAHRDRSAGEEENDHPASTLPPDRKSTRLNSSHTVISYAVYRVLHSFPTRRSSDLGHVWTGMRSPIDNLDVGDLGDGGSKGKDVATRQRWNGAAARWVMAHRDRSAGEEENDHPASTLP